MLILISSDSSIVERLPPNSLVQTKGYYRRLLLYIWKRTRTRCPSLAVNVFLGSSHFLSIILGKKNVFFNFLLTLLFDYCRSCSPWYFWFCNFLMIFWVIDLHNVINWILLTIPQNLFFGKKKKNSNWSNGQNIFLTLSLLLIAPQAFKKTWLQASNSPSSRDSLIII